MGLEPIARWIYATTFASERKPPGPGVLLRRLIGNDRIRFVDGRSTITRDASGFRVTIERGLDPERVCFRFAAAVATVGILHHGLSEASPENVRRLALRIIMPRVALRYVLQCVGPRPIEIGRIFVVSRDLALERLESIGLRLASGQYRRPTMLDVG